MVMLNHWPRMAVGGGGGGGGGGHNFKWDNDLRKIEH